MSSFLQEAYNIASNTEFEEVPVDIEEFVQSEDFCNLPPLSDIQYDIIRNGSQIYRKETLISMYGEDKGLKRWAETNNEVVLQLGKGSGKDYTSTIVCAYVVYLLLCLKDPARYYGKPQDDTIDIVNIAINSDQAKNVFFKNFKTRIKNCKWFRKRYTAGAISIEFDKNINVYSGHSEREAFEGLNLILAVLDEISGFALESNTGNAQANTAQATYEMYRDSVDSRFDLGKVLMLSFPRFKDDYIQQAYNRIIAEKETVTKSHTFKIDPELPDGTEGNEFTVEWEEDHIIRYTDPYLYALKRPTWEVNPTRGLDSPQIIRAFRTNPYRALGKYACMPSNLDEGFIKNHAKIEAAFNYRNNVDEAGVFHDKFAPIDEGWYYMHVDLAQKHDYCAVALAHVDKWMQFKMGEYTEDLPLVTVDLVRWWKPTKDKSVDFKEVEDFVKAVRRRGFDIKLCTFDRWNSHDTMNSLERDGISTDTLSVNEKHYDDLLNLMYDDRLNGPKEEILITELKELRQVKRGQKLVIDHPRTGTKDLSDAVTGAIFNAVSNTPKPIDTELETFTLAQLTAAERAASMVREDGVIRDPRHQGRMPDDIATYLAQAVVL